MGMSSLNLKNSQWQWKTFCNANGICPLRSSLHYEGFEYDEKKPDIHGDVVDGILIESLSLGFGSIMLRSNDSNSADEHSFHGLSQMKDPTNNPSATSVDDLMSGTGNSCLEDLSGGDAACLKNNLEDSEGQSHLDLGLTDNTEKTDKIQSSEMVSAINDTILHCSQVEESRLSQSTSSIHDIVSCPENSSIDEWSERDGGFAGKYLDNIGEGQSELVKTEHIVDKAFITESVAQGLNVEEKVTECIDSQYSDQDYSSQLQEPISEVDACITPKTTMLELLVLNSRESNQNNDTKKKMAPIWKIIADHRFAGPFRKPLTDWEVPGYTEIVKRPMDLSTIKKGLSKGRIRTHADFQRDVLLMLQNAVMYNPINHRVHQLALELQRDVQELLQVFNAHVKESEEE
ncbi:uncharacterized protein ACNLHF_016715 [Anomaloglossus baeobatrachus]|uniref:uncharacterized protein LOC142302371 n=1 Tax=Anomaloglossus baeobatrachus TaxID=238106 RepID=UPI003F502926